MKKIIVYSHALKDPIFLECGDQYDSYAEVYENGKLVHKVRWVNVDSSNTYDPDPATPQIEKIEIANGKYLAVVGYHKGKYKALRLIAWGTYNPANETAMSRTLPTIQPNPRHKGRNIAEAVNWHKGGWKSDWSEACLTTPEPEYEKFMDCIEMGEIVEIEKRGI